MYFNFGIIRQFGPLFIKRSRFKAPFASKTRLEKLSTGCGKSNADVRVTKDEAIKFVEEFLELHNPIESATDNPLKFLFEFHKRIRYSIPFTNLCYVTKIGYQAVDPKKKKDLLFRQKGGLCFDVFSLIRDVLHYLGYKSLLISAGLPSTRTRLTQSHVGLVVKDVACPGSTHLMELGTMYPILQPVKLDFPKVSQEYNLGPYPIRFFKDELGMVQMCRQDDGERRTDGIKFEGRRWKVSIIYRPFQHLSTQDCNRNLDYLFKNTSEAPDMRYKLFVFGFSHGLPTSIFGNKFFQYGGKGLNGPEKRMLQNNSEIVETIQEHFPQYSIEKLEEALKCLNSHRQLNIGSK